MKLYKTTLSNFEDKFMKMSLFSSDMVQLVIEGANISWFRKRLSSDISRDSSEGFWGVSVAPRGREAWGCHRTSSVFPEFRSCWIRDAMGGGEVSPQSDHKTTEVTRPRTDTPLCGGKTNYSLYLPWVGVRRMTVFHPSSRGREQKPPVDWSQVLAEFHREAREGRQERQPPTITHWPENRRRRKLVDSWMCPSLPQRWIE